HAVAVSNCTTALHLTLAALGIGPWDEVICPSMSFIATANAIRHAGADPVFADVDPDTYNLDPAAVERAITPRTRAILVVHQHGMSVPDTARHSARTVITESYLCMGYNYRMTDIQAAVGLEQMKKLPWIVSRRRRLAERYTEAFRHHPWLLPPVVPPYAEPNF